MLSQYILFLYFFLLGAGLAFCYSVFKSIVFVCKNNIIVQIICDLGFSAILGIAFIFAINTFNSGEIRMFLVVAMLFGGFIYAKTLGKLFAKGAQLFYNHLVKLFRRFKSSKFGKVLFK